LKRSSDSLAIRQHWQQPGSALKVISWNLLRRTGAAVTDVAALIQAHQPDLLFMQEATEEIDALPSAVSGYLLRQHLHSRIYGLAVWSKHILVRPHALALPVSKMPGRMPPRIAQIVSVVGITFANVHLSHGQLLNRRQLLRIARALEDLDGPAAIIGDYNTVGPTKLSGFRDIGPRERTHLARNILPFRLDRCMGRGLECVAAQVLQRGPSDHHPILLNLSVAQASATAAELPAA
jgi:endonuclease/exonuclease/phosphatase (EEP) superfamily protein YafD